jgi:hypothetical protein
VAAQAGIVIVPMSVARVHHRKDVVAVPVTGVEETQVGLAWPRDAEDPRVEVFIGIVRGRTERSSRGESATPGKVQRAKKPAKPAPSGRGAHSRRPGASGRSAKPGKGKRRR